MLLVGLFLLISIILPRSNKKTPSKTKKTHIKTCTSKKAYCLKRLNRELCYLLNKNCGRLLHHCSLFGVQIFFITFLLKRLDVEFPYYLMPGQILLNTTLNFISLKFYSYILSGELQISLLTFIRLKHFLGDTAGQNGLVHFSSISVLQEPSLGHSTLCPPILNEAPPTPVKT